MKLKELFYVLGARPRTREYGSAVREFTLPRDGPVRYAQWLHPLETPKTVEQSAVDALRGFLRPGDAQGWPRPLPAGRFCALAPPPRP